MREASNGKCQGVISAMLAEHPVRSEAAFKAISRQISQDGARVPSAPHWNRRSGITFLNTTTKANPCRWRRLLACG